MSQTHSESGKAQSPSLPSLNPSPQQGPPSASRTSDKREDTSSMKSTKRSLRSRIPFFRKKGSTTSLPEEPSPPSSPAPSSPSESPEYLSSSGLTAKPVMSTDPTLPPTPSMNVPTPHTPRDRSSVDPSPPSPTYDELLQQIALLQQRKNLRDSPRETTSSPNLPPTTTSWNEPSSVTAPSLSSTSAQVAHNWRESQRPSIGSDRPPPEQRPTPSTRSKQRATISVLSMSQSGSSDTDSIAPSRSDKSSQESLSLHGWRPEPTPDITTPESRERDFMSIWRSRRALIPTEATWTHSEEGQAWMQADPAEQEDIISYCADVQAVSLFNNLHPLHPYKTPEPYRSRFPKPPPPRPLPLASHEPRRRRRPASPQIHKQTQGMYLGPGRVQAGSGGAGASTSKPMDNDDDDDDDDKKNDGKKPEKPAEPWKPGTGFFRGDPPPGLFSDPVARDKERWSIPGAPNKFDPSQDPPNPVGAMADDAPWLGCKPDLARKPNPFIGDSDDIDRFITDCQVYFQVYSAYLWLDSYRVAFAASYFEGRAKDWWTMQLADLYSNSRGKYRFPTWYAFKQAVEKKFSDPGVEEKHKVDMYALRMTGTMTATEYLQELEKLAKKAKLQNDTGDRGHMVTALRQGVPASYTTIIANMGVNIPVGYEQWGERIILMNEERQRKQAFDLMGKMYQPRSPPPPKTNPPYAGASKGSSGATTSSADKTTASGTTYGGRGRPMDIDAVKSGNCFRCGKKGHISKNCPLQSWNKGKQEVRASTTEPSGSKIEEVKDDAGK
ncbi:hypothetical protein EV421DRAFT_1956368 [Armillaria borealis]|uniref:CCHC-type domain-containing protein n=1 Tax=Armillaria borealis TaxID=47425 RepID=A0AA39K546_9AGAR|nr:hypothetical protein EV421DRAFT_1956368 [Armillaria borealis]